MDPCIEKLTQKALQLAQRRKNIGKERNIQSKIIKHLENFLRVRA